MIKLDAWSVRQMVEQISEADIRGFHSAQSHYFGYYSEFLTSLSCDASNMFNELDRLLERLDLELPQRSPRFDYYGEVYLSGVYWFDSAAILTGRCDLVTLLTNEEIVCMESGYGRPASYYENKRVNAVKALAKEQNQLLLMRAIGFLTRYRRLCHMYDTIFGIIDGLDFHHTPIVDKKGETHLHPSSWV